MNRFNRRNVFLWSLYDFANSLAFANVSFYFALWFVSDRGWSDLFVTVATALSTVVLLLTIPILGRFSDGARHRTFCKRNFGFR
jgi:MFS-type transporter involved in bile tolerance (Atg22 family)